MEKLSLKNRKEQTIIGLLEIPEGPVQGTCVVLHGWGGHKNKSTVQAIKDAFLISGFQTFNFDTTNSFGESDGEYEKSTLGLHWEDLEDVAKWVQQQEWFKGPLALAGHSKGGYAVARYAEEYPSEVAYLVSVAPVVSGKLSFEVHKKRDPEGLRRWKESGIVESVGKDGNLKRKHWFQMEERLNHDLLPNADKLVMPTLLLVGSDDTSCPPETIQVLFNAIPDGGKFIEIIEGAPHSYDEEVEHDACREIIARWLKAHR